MCIIILNLNKHHPKLVPHPPLNNAVHIGFHSFLTRLDFTNMIIVTKNVFKKMHFIWVSMYLARSANWGHYINVSYWRGDCHFTWSSEPCEDLAICWAKLVPLFLSYFKTLSIGLTPGIEPTTSRSAVKRSTNWADPAAVKIYKLFML